MKWPQCYQGHLFPAKNRYKYLSLSVIVYLNVSYLYNWALEKHISRKLLHLRMYAMIDPKIFPVKLRSWLSFFSKTSIKNSLILRQLKQNLVAFNTPSLPSFPLIAKILSTSTIFLALSIISSHMTWKNWAWVLSVQNNDCN